MKIKSKKIIQIEEPVYDITVPETRNFLIEQGVFAHNCDHPKDVIGGWTTENAGITVPGSKDVSDACCGVVYDIFVNPIQTNITDIAQSIQKAQYSITQNNLVEPVYYNTAKTPMTQRQAMQMAMKMFNK